MLQDETIQYEVSSTHLSGKLDRKRRQVIKKKFIGLSFVYVIEMN